MATAKKKSVKKSEAEAVRKRRVVLPQYKSFRVSKKIKRAKTTLPSVLELSKRSVQQLKTQKRLFIGITIVYGLLILVFVRGMSGGMDVQQLKANIGDITNTNSGAVGSSFALFGVLLGSASATNGDLASLYQTLILILVSLALIWSLRRVQSGDKDRIQIRDAFYKSTYAFIPFLLVLLVVSLQLIPLAIGNLIYTFVIQGGIATTSIEQFLWLVLVFLLVVLSLYMITSSIFALYIVTLPDTRPMQALRAAREIVRFRRWTIMRKILILPLLLILLLAVVTLPSILLVPMLAGWIFFIATMVLLPLLHSYMYALYRALL